MRSSYSLTGLENRYDSQKRLVSTTDLRGKITYANQHFLDIAGYNDGELNGQPHNIIRHPDMPRAAFADLWQTIRQKKPWMGIVKNRCKNGDHYWVDAYVTPVYEDGKVIGYQSVRTKPDEQHKRNAEKLYRAINNGSNKLQWPKPALRAKLMLAFAVSIAPIVLALLSTPQTQWLFLPIGLTLIIAGISIHWISKPWRDAAKASEAIFHNPIARQVYTDRSDELGQLLLVIKALQAQVKTITTRVSENAVKLEEVAENTSTIVEQSNRSIQQQRPEIENVSTAMQQMASSIEEVAKNTANTAMASKQADDEVATGRDIVRDTVSQIEALADQVSNTSDVVSKLKDDSYTIASVVDVIRGIADQTNLLALNAAIEAARAGEAGRGFAVVADQVRSLASKTRDSTDEIQSMIDSFRESTDKAVIEMEKGHQKASDSVEHVEKANAALDCISQSVSTIHNMSLQIASTSEEQSAVAEDISRNISNINQNSLETAKISQDTASASEKLIGQVQGMKTLVVQFGS